MHAFLPKSNQKMTVRWSDNSEYAYLWQAIFQWGQIHRHFTSTPLTMLLQQQDIKHERKYLSHLSDWEGTVESI